MSAIAADIKYQARIGRVRAQHSLQLYLFRFSRRGNLQILIAKHC
jgi:hypothetical protein